MTDLIGQLSIARREQIINYIFNIVEGISNQLIFDKLLIPNLNRNLLRKKKFAS